MLLPTLAILITSLELHCGNLSSRFLDGTGAKLLYDPPLLTHSIFRLKHSYLGDGANSKTLALQVTCNHLSSYPNATTLWIDATGDFSPTKADIVLRSTEPREVRLLAEAA